MSTPVRVALFVTALALVFGTAWGVGRLVEDRVGPVEVATDTHAGDTHDDSEEPDGRTQRWRPTSPAGSRSARPATPSSCPPAG